MMSRAMLARSPSPSDKATWIRPEPRVREFGRSISPVVLNHVAKDEHPQRKRNHAENSDTEVIMLSPRTLMETHRFVCEICNQDFPRDQNLQMHLRGHNLMGNLKKGNKNEEDKKKVYVCPEKTCNRHNSSQTFGNLAAVKKHYCRKHGEKKFKCDKCLKKYAVESDLKVHSKKCGNKGYQCDCATNLMRLSSFIQHRSHCISCTTTNTPSMASQERPNTNPTATHVTQPPIFMFNQPHLAQSSFYSTVSSHHNQFHISYHSTFTSSPFYHLFNVGATLSQNTTTMGSSSSIGSKKSHPDVLAPTNRPKSTETLTHDFMGLIGQCGGSEGNESFIRDEREIRSLLQNTTDMGSSSSIGSTVAHPDMLAPSNKLKSTEPRTRDFLGLIGQCGGSEGNVSHDEYRSEIRSYAKGLQYKSYGCDGQSSFMKHNNESGYESGATQDCSGY